MLRQISRFTSKRPDGVRKRKFGGLRGYVVGRVMRPWYSPPAKGEGDGGPRRVKCHSWRLESETGAAWKVGLGFGDEAESSAVSLRRRRMVGEGAMVRLASSCWE